MLNLIQTNMCGGNNTNAANETESHYLSSNLQQNGNLRTEQFEESMKIEQITSGDRIAYIKISDDVVVSPTSAKSELENRRHRYFLQKYPDFFRHYCLCLHRKVEPDDLNTVSRLVDDKYNGFLLNRTPIIPITVDPKKYVIFHNLL